MSRSIENSPQTVSELLQWEENVRANSGSSVVHIANKRDMCMARDGRVVGAVEGAMRPRPTPRPFHSTNTHRRRDRRFASERCSSTSTEQSPPCWNLIFSKASSCTCISFIPSDLLLVRCFLVLFSSDTVVIYYVVLLVGSFDRFLDSFMKKEQIWPWMMTTRTATQLSALTSNFRDNNRKKSLIVSSVLVTNTEKLIMSSREFRVWKVHFGMLLHKSEIKDNYSS